ncbi:hypothetical protein ISN45_At04g015680 [Arabidopsis thaliana x Arabidopsis arenosa]|uniref:Uncharacterized protein n=2 Tax=Arabidopsis TaxID=3701 RepID=A0A8T2E918_ARASU|nr:hypothetical protein ISN45_At04g015680 [Arabidopsis thaliana x Arabidopsis arenosa]KAG7620527.1 hypothetical protein ISN44_As04g015230 [Arabidopsis suecica]
MKVYFAGYVTMYFTWYETVYSVEYIRCTPWGTGCARRVYSTIIP